MEDNTKKSAQEVSYKLTDDLGLVLIRLFQPLVLMKVSHRRVPERCTEARNYHHGFLSETRMPVNDYASLYSDSYIQL